MTGSPTRTVCPYCGVGCGIIASPQTDGSVAIAGDPDHPANFGRLCSKGRALGETLSLDGRLLHPEVDGQRTSWDVALSRVAQTFRATIAEHGPQSVAFYGSGQLLTEDYYVANKLMKGFIGAANIDTNSRLCMASTVSGHRRAFGADVVPGLYEDLEQADLVVLVGANLAWCHPVLNQRLEVAREKRGTKVVVVDPRRSASAEGADLHLRIAPEGDVALFRGLFSFLENFGHKNSAFAAHVDGGAPPPALSIQQAALQSGAPLESLRQFYALFAEHERVVTVFSQGVNQSASGVDKVNAIIDCHLLTGRIGRPGMGPFSVTGQPNAMGGREVGGLANLLAAHMDIGDPAARKRVEKFWNAPRLAQSPGLKAVDLFRAIDEGTVKAVWIMATNPAVSMPDADRVERALSRCPFVVISEAVRDTQTTRLAHVFLPATAWGEKNGVVTNSERRISRHRAFLPPPGEARPDWDIISDVARRMGFLGFDYQSPAEIFKEHAALSGFENDGARAFDISAYADIDESAYEKLNPFLWPAPKNPHDSRADEDGRFFANGGFYTSDHKAKIVHPEPPDQKPCDGNPEDPYGFVMGTGRIRDQWHTMTRTGKAARLMAQFGEPFVEISPVDARRLGIAPASLVELSGPTGRAVARALVTDRQSEGVVFTPMHWSDPFAYPARVNALAAHPVDPLSGQPALKSAPVALAPFRASWYGFAVCAARPRIEKMRLDYFALALVEGGFRLEAAGCDKPQDWEFFARELFGLEEATVEWIGVQDYTRQSFRFAAFADDRLLGLLIIASQPVEASREFLAQALTRPHIGSARLRLLAGRTGAHDDDQNSDRGAVICACMNVGLRDIVAAIQAGAQNVEQVGQACGAGTGCGSCRLEIKRALSEQVVAQAS